MTMVAASCGGSRRIESRRCNSTTCAANGSWGRGSRRSDSAVRAGRGEPPEQAPVSARPGPRARRRARPGGADESAGGESTDLALETSGTVVRCRAAVTAAGVRPPSRTTPVGHEPRTSAAPWGSSSWERDPSGRRTVRRSPRTVHRTTWGAEPAGRRRRCRVPPPMSSGETSPGSTSADLLRS